MVKDLIYGLLKWSCKIKGRKYEAIGKWYTRETTWKPIYLINTARGKILHTQALVDALQEGGVLGAALDVVEYESTSFVSLDVATLPTDFRYLQQHDRCILSPHVAGWSHRAKRLHAQVLADKVTTWWEGKAKDER